LHWQRQRLRVSIHRPTHLTTASSATLLRLGPTRIPTQIPRKCPMRHPNPLRECLNPFANEMSRSEFRMGGGEFTPFANALPAGEASTIRLDSTIREWRDHSRTLGPTSHDLAAHPGGTAPRTHHRPHSIHSQMGLLQDSPARSSIGDIVD
jgi:hypothetical protein